MNKVLELLIKYLGMPLLQKLGEWILKAYQEWKKKNSIKKEQKKKEEAVNDAKTPEQIRAAHRNNKL
jgi:hypothetical protein